MGPLGLNCFRNPIESLLCCEVGYSVVSISPSLSSIDFPAGTRHVNIIPLQLIQMSTCHKIFNMWVMSDYSGYDPKTSQI